MEEEEQRENSSVHVATALNLVWSFGINKDIPVLNLSDGKQKGLFYVTSRTGVLYDFKSNTQVLYQGHSNAISSTCVSTNKKWLATADIGKDCILLVWDTEKSIPIKTLFDVDPVGIKAICMSDDAKYIASLGCTIPQIVSFWDWTTENDEPLVLIQLPATYGIQNFIAFNKENGFECVSNSEKNVVFYDWDKEKNITFDAPELNDKDFNKAVGNFSQTIFQPNDIALTATSRGNIVVWIKTSATKRKASKVVRFQESAITVLHVIDSYLVTGDILGNIKFFDRELKLVNWYKHLGLEGAINSISFTYNGTKNAEQNVTAELYPDSSTLDSVPFVVDDFSVSTQKGQYLYMKTEGSAIEYVRKENERYIEAIACHPREPLIAIGGHCGLLQIVDYETKKVVTSRQFNDRNTEITSVMFSPEGDFLAVGFDSGHLYILDAVTLEAGGREEDRALFDYSNDAISEIRFSHNSKYLACSDKDRCIVVFLSNFDNENKPWTYLGKYRSHYKQIKDLIFLKSLDEDSVRLLSLGEDRMLVEYDLEGSSVDDLKLKSKVRIEQDATPICLASYPSLSKEHFILVGNDRFKFKLLNCTTKMCRYTFLGPTYSSPVQRILNLPHDESHTNRYMVYSTSDKVGLAILPLDGNPHKTMALISHPGRVHNLACSYDAKYVFTAGGGDNTVFMWRVDINTLEANAALGGEDLIPFYAMIDDGRDGEFFTEMEEYFYYAQLREQGVDSMAGRTVTNTIPLSQIPFVMRALGFYPTEQQIENMLNEMKFSEYVNTGYLVENIDLGTFLKLYINHRPAFGMHLSQLVSAFKKIAVSENDNDGNNEVQISRSDLLSILQERGEHMTEYELANYLTLLLGDGDDSKDDDSAGKSLEQLPENISMSLFASELLGLASEERT